MVTKNEVGRKGASNSALVWHCGDRGLFSIWTCWFPVKLFISVSACYSDVLSFLWWFFPISFLRSALPIQDVNIHKAIGIGGTIVYFLRRNRFAGWILRIFGYFGGSPGITYWRSYSWEAHFVPLCLFVKTSPVNLAVVSENGNMYFEQKLHVQMENSHRSPQSQSKSQP